MKEIKKFMPVKKKQILTSFKVDKDLYEKCKKKLKENSQSTHDLIETAMKIYLEEK